MTTLPRKPCRYCHGSGTEIDHSAVGFTLRTLRLKKEIGLREMARGMGVSAPFLSDMELGKRNWTQERIDQFNEVIKKGDGQ